MNKFLDFFRRAMPHLVTILSLVILTLVIFNHYNPYMQFIENDGTQTMIAMLCILGVYESIILMQKDRGKD